MKHKYITTVSIGVVLFMSLSIGSVYAWTNMNKYVEGCGVTNSEVPLVAGNGDVVTTDKWNLAMCAINNLWYILLDGPRAKTYFVKGQSNDGGYVVKEINLPSSSNLIGNNNGYAGGIHFKDPSQSYANYAGYHGGIVYNEDFASLDLLHFSGGVRIEGPQPAAPKYLLGWEKINPLSTDHFDSKCKYRVSLSWLDQEGNPTGMIYPEGTNALRLVFSSDSDWGDTQYFPIQHVIEYTAKNTIKSAYAGGGAGSQFFQPIGSVGTIEKLCLPSYNPNGY